VRKSLWGVKFGADDDAEMTRFINGSKFACRPAAAARGPWHALPLHRCGAQSAAAQEHCALPSAWLASSTAPLRRRGHNGAGVMQRRAFEKVPAAAAPVGAVLHHSVARCDASHARQ
jgi:hypothetical protein